MTIDIQDGTKKMRIGKYVVYDTDYLLDNLTREAEILEKARKRKVSKFDEKEFDKYLRESCYLEQGITQC